MSINKYIVLLSLISFLISLNQVVFFDSPNYREHTYGWQILVVGWFGIFRGSLISISWLANPFLIFSWFNFKKLGISFKFSVISLLFSLFFVIYDAFIKEFQYPNYSNGFYFWISSILIMFLGNLYLIIQSNKENK